MVDINIVIDHSLSLSCFQKFSQIRVKQNAVFLKYLGSRGIACGFDKNLQQKRRFDAIILIR